MSFLKLTVAYDGTGYAGWQIQPASPTIQGALAQAWLRITGEEPNFSASGRTDAGVHAEAQIVGVETQSTLSPWRLRKGLNAVLPEDIVVRLVEPAPTGFHATYDALRKTYRYQLHDGPAPPLFDRRYVWWWRAGRLDDLQMGQGGERFVGRHDFVSLQSLGSDRSTTVRTISNLSVTRTGDRLDITVTGDGFLYNMVRTIAGTLVEVGRGSKPPEWIAEVLAARDRSAAGPTAPAEGLVLASVEYQTA
ncbi:tRNA pseudouridine(38-40) synthase TruA [Botrimarina hoheduenensis]|uniref:tRNA pseudouridine synthase A n=1 Tax=Botrimarina hoheduenensis TaxID=2528000 RepID=A0A5C5VSF9_9BACT|nr:tRNA pseudouridine(38-40) synthase TruA [Botrimarina hoheduenensis]TWT41564.1 tRNA pseudouridine synthase A [Botrimarina hoheduenensis]